MPAQRGEEGAQKKPTAYLNRVPQHVGGVVDGSLTFFSFAPLLAWHLQRGPSINVGRWQLIPFLCVSLVRMDTHPSSRDSGLSEP